MDLTHEYLKTKGIAGELKEINKNNPHLPHTVLCYSTEGCIPEYHVCHTEEEADEMLKHWEITGDFVIKRLNMERSSIEEPDIIHEVHRPSIVRVLKLDKAYRRQVMPREVERKSLEVNWRMITGR